MYSLRMSFCTVPESFREVGALFFGDGDVEAEQNRGGGVDGHRGGDFFERDAVEKSFHVFERIDGDADFADFAESERMVGVHADLRGEIEGDGEAGLALARGDSDSAGWIRRRCRSRRTGAWSRGGRGTWWDRCRGCREIRRDSRGAISGSQPERSSCV